MTLLAYFYNFPFSQSIFEPFTYKMAISRPLESKTIRRRAEIIKTFGALLMRQFFSRSVVFILAVKADGRQCACWDVNRPVATARDLTNVRQVGLPTREPF